MDANKDHDHGTANSSIKEQKLVKNLKNNS